MTYPRNNNGSVPYRFGVWQFPNNQTRYNMDLIIHMTRTQYEAALEVEKISPIFVEKVLMLGAPESAESVKVSAETPNDLFHFGFLVGVQCVIGGSGSES